MTSKLIATSPFCHKLVVGTRIIYREYIDILINESPNDYNQPQRTFEVFEEKYHFKQKHFLQMHPLFNSFIEILEV